MGIKIQPLKKVGYWKDIKSVFAFDNFPDPRKLVDPSWSRDEREVISIYLDAGKTHETWMGYSYCRFNCGTHLSGSRDLTDGHYVWPEDLSHYLREHSVRLPREFLEHVVRQLLR